MPSERRLADCMPWPPVTGIVGFYGAGDLAELAMLAAPDDAAVHRVRAEVNEARAAAERSVMAQDVYRWAARESRRAGS